ncbi:MAG: hypothetical protein QG567_1819 [Campylobacterota bacterium]|nr:hypothetical protein [Campylobacterota bacterium]
MAKQVEKKKFVKNPADREAFKNKVKKNIQFFISRRYDFVLLIMAIGYYNISSSLDDTTNLLKQKDKQIASMASLTTYITDSGVIKQYEKEHFDVHAEKFNVAQVLSRYLVKSAFNLTGGYKKTFFENEEKLFKETPDFIEFYTNYIDINPKLSTEKNIADSEKAKNDWKQILRWFRAAVNENDLPHVMDKKESDIKIERWETDDNQFSIYFSIPAYAKSLNKNNVEDEGLSTVYIRATGYYDLLQKNTINSYGMKITSLELTHPKINHQLILKKD